MTTWNIVFLIANLLFLGVNIFLFIKLKGASDQMMKMAFPGAKNMNEAMGQMQAMLGGLQKGGKRGGGGFPGGAGGPGGVSQAQMKAAMDMLAQLQGKKR